MTRSHFGLLSGILLAFCAAGCGSDGGSEPNEPPALNLTEQQLNTAVLGDHLSVAMGPDGRIAVAWQESTNASQRKIRLQRFTASGFKDGPVVDVEPGPNLAHSVAFGPQGESFLAYSPIDVTNDYNRSIKVQRYAADGSPLGAASLVNPDGTTAGLVFGAGGQGVVLSIQCADTRCQAMPLSLRMGVTRLTAEGVAAGPESVLGTYRYNDEPSIFAAVLADGSFAVL
jgi:hypothetical protein